MDGKIKRRDILKGGIAVSLSSFAAGNSSAAVDKDPFPPKKIVKATPLSYSPLNYLDTVAGETSPKLAFKASTLKEANEWKKSLRSRLWELLGESHTPGESKSQAKLLNKDKLEGYTREKWELEVVPGRSMPFYILRPDGVSGKYKTVLCLHGHGNGAKDIIGMPVDEKAADLIRTINTDYALQCVKKGWCAVAPDLFAFGERVDYVEDARPGFDGGCEKPFLNAVQVGKNLIGIRAKDVCVLIDWMTAQKDLDTAELPCIGLSGGAMMTMYVTALDERVKRAIIAGYMTEARASVLAIRHCSCNYVPNLFNWADFPDIGCLIAPRFLIIQSGKKDGIFPIESVRNSYEKIKKCFNLYSKPENVLLHEHEGFHSFWSKSLDSLLKTD